MFRDRRATRRTLPLIGLVLGLTISVPGPALAQSESAEQASHDSAITADRGAADYGVLIDYPGINFISTGALTVPAVPGGNAVKGPAAGPEPRQPKPDATFPPPEEAVP